MELTVYHAYDIADAVDKVYFSTLQELREYVEKLNPKHLSCVIRFETMELIYL